MALIFSIKASKYLRYALISTILSLITYIFITNGVKKLLVLLPSLFHVQFFLFLGIWLWGINIYTLEKANIDCTSLLALESKPLTNNSLNSFISYKNIFHLAEWYSLFYFSCIILYYYSSLIWERENTQWISVISTIISFFILFMPFKTIYKRERKKFVRALKRILKPTLSIETSFCDVVLADLITSFSKVIGDLYIALAELFIVYCVSPIVENTISNKSQEKILPFDMNIDIVTTDDLEIHKKNIIHIHHHILLDAIGSFVILLPYLFRLKQCLADVRTKATKAQRKKSLFNAFKYASSIPVYFFSGYYSWLKSDIKNTNADKNELIQMIEKAEFIFFFWIISSIINSAYSYFWDVFMDWDLGKRNGYSNGFPVFLRPVLHFSRKWVYYLVILVDGILRFTWLVDVLSIFGIRHVFIIDDQPAMTDDEIQYQIEKLLLARLLLRLLEILRRWLWIFFRLEREWVYTNSKYIKIEDDKNYKSINTPVSASPNHEIPIIIQQFPEDI